MSEVYLSLHTYMCMCAPAPNKSWSSAMLEYSTSIVWKSILCYLSVIIHNNIIMIMHGKLINSIKWTNIITVNL